MVMSPIPYIYNMRAGRADVVRRAAEVVSLHCSHGKRAAAPERRNPVGNITNQPKNSIIMIYYKVIKRKNPKDGTVKFYAQSKNQSYMTLDDVAENISRECTLTVHDVKAALSVLEEQVPLALYEGKSVRFGDLGSFHLTIKSRGVTNKADFKASDVKRVMVRFVRSRAMRSAFDLSNSKIKFANSEAATTKSGSSEVTPNV